MNGAELLLAIVGGLAILAIKSAALSISMTLARTVIRIFTIGLGKQIRCDRLADLDAYLHDFIHDLRQQGYRPSEIAWHVFWHRSIIRLGDEVIWRVSRSPLVFARVWLGVMTVSGMMLAVSTAFSMVTNFVLFTAYGPLIAAVMTGLTIMWAGGALLLARGIVGLHVVLYGNADKS